MIHNYKDIKLSVQYNSHFSNQNDSFIKILYTKEIESYPDIIAEFIKWNINEIDNISLIFVSKLNELQTIDSPINDSDQSFEFCRLNFFDETNETVNSDFLIKLLHTMNVKLAMNLSFTGFNNSWFINICKSNLPFFKTVKVIRLESFKTPLKLSTLNCIKMD